MDKPHIRLKPYVGVPTESRWATHWKNGARFVNIAWMTKAMEFVRRRNRVEARGIHKVGGKNA